MHAAERGWDSGTVRSAAACAAGPARGWFLLVNDTGLITMAGLAASRPRSVPRDLPVRSPGGAVHRRAQRRTRGMGRLGSTSMRYWNVIARAGRRRMGPERIDGHPGSAEHGGEEPEMGRGRTALDGRGKAAAKIEQDAEDGEEPGDVFGHGGAGPICIGGMGVGRCGKRMVVHVRDGPEDCAMA